MNRYGCDNKFVLSFWNSHLHPETQGRLVSYTGFNSNWQPITGFLMALLFHLGESEPNVMNHTHAGKPGSRATTIHCDCLVMSSICSTIVWDFSDVLFYKCFIFVDKANKFSVRRTNCDREKRFEKTVQQRDSVAGTSHTWIDEWTNTPTFVSLREPQTWLFPL